MRILKITAILLCAAMLSSCIVLQYPENPIIDLVTVTPTEVESREPETEPPHTETTASISEYTDAPQTESQAPDTETAPETTAPESTEASETEPYIKSIFLISLTSPISINQTARIDIIGKADTEYDIDVIYALGESTAKGLENKVSSDIGAVSWSWKIGPSVKTGRYKIIITGGGDTLETEIQVN